MLKLLVSTLLTLFLCGAAIADPAQLPEPKPLPEPNTSGDVPHAGALIHYMSYGTGSPVILLHGGLASSRYWVNQIAPLQRTHRVVLIDSRGSGRSTRDDRPLSYELMASDVVSVMDRLRIRRASLVGWSDGAIVGLVLAMRDPSRLRSVFAFAPNMDSSGVDMTAAAKPPFSTFLSRAGDEYRTASGGKDDFPRLEEATLAMWKSQPNYSARDLGRIGVPVTIVGGGEDAIIRPAHLRYLARVIPHAQLRTLAHANHFGMLQDSVEFNPLLLSTLPL